MELRECKMNNLNQISNLKSCQIDYEKNWLTIWFDNPQKRNALTFDLINDLQTIFDKIKDDTSIRGVVFRGKNEVFCSGADLKFMKKIISEDANSKKESIKLSKGLGLVFKMITELPQITVSAVEGPAMAGAFGIVCSSDLVLSMSNARFAMTETRLGLSPAQIAPYVIDRLGFSNARKLILLGFSIDGNQAYDMGLTDYLSTTKEEFNETLNSIKRQVNQCSPHALTLTKNIIRPRNEIDIDLSAKIFAECIESEEGKEGIKSFFEKKKPYWAVRS